MKKRLIIVDVSNFIFRAFFAIRALNAPDGTPVNAVHGVLGMLLKLISKYRPTHILVAKDSAGPSFRNKIYPEYKANRSEPPEDLIPQFALIKELIEKMDLPYCQDGEFEADDIGKILRNNSEGINPKRIDLEGDVRVVIANEMLKTESATYFDKKGLLISQKPVKIEGPNRLSYGENGFKLTGLKKSGGCCG